MRIPTLLIGLLVFALPVAAETDRLTESEFEQLFHGRTVFFSQRGRGFGSEEYRRDRTVIWQFLEGNQTCQRGVWTPGPDQSICFLYEERPDDPICWHFFRQEGDILARVIGADPADDLKVEGETRAPLNCPGPDVGV